MENVQPAELTRIIGANVRRRREELRLTQEDLATKIRMPQSYISVLEAGKRTPRVATLARLAEALSVPPSHLVDAQVAPAG